MRKNVECGIDLHSLTLRLACPGELTQWQALMSRHHYLGFKRIVGEALYYVVTHDEQWIALLGWGSAALKCAYRDRWIGWEPHIKYKRLHLVANNVRFLILSGCHQRNLASRILSLNLKRLSHDWEQYHGHPVLLAETFVDISRFQGTCYKAAGWQQIGKTRGYSKRNRHYWHNNRPKLIFVKALARHATDMLRAPFLSPKTLKSREGIMIDINKIPIDGESGLLEVLGTLTDPRKARGIRHSMVTVLAIAVCAILSGARSYSAIAEWAQGLSIEAMLKLGVIRDRPPSEPTIRRLLQKIYSEELDRKIGQWLSEKVPGFKAIAIDGKTIRGAHDAGEKPPHFLSAIIHQSPNLVIAQTEVESKTNEIPKLRELLQPLPIENTVVTADALHTQRKTARFIVEDKKADYVFTVKDNQKMLRQDIEDLNLTDFPP